MEQKCVMVIHQDLPLGAAANTAAILGITLGKRLPQVVGEDVYDGDGGLHAGIISFPVPILRGTAEQLRTIRARLYEPAFADVTAEDFSDLAQGCRDYGEFIQKMSETESEGLGYFGVALCGARKKVNKLTGSMPLL